jgi:hypothetical protein
VAQNALRPAGGSGPDRAASVNRQQQHLLDTRPEPDFQAFARCRVASRLGLSLPFVAAKLACIEVSESGLRRLREATPGPEAHQGVEPPDPPTAAQADWWMVTSKARPEALLEMPDRD